MCAFDCMGNPHGVVFDFIRFNYSTVPIETRSIKAERYAYVIRCYIGSIKFNTYSKLYTKQVKVVQITLIINSNV